MAASSATALDVLLQVREILPELTERLSQAKSILAIVKGRVTEAEEKLEETAMLISSFL